MEILLLNQAFYPDVVATAQYATDLAVCLAQSGHRVSVLTSRRGYDNPGQVFAGSEVWKGIRIVRVPMLCLGKQSRWRRALDFGSFFVTCLLRMLLLRRFDLIIGLTSPPLISALGAMLAVTKGGKFMFWVMDLNPDQAIAAGWLRAGSRTARLLNVALRFSLEHSDQVIALDRFMADRLTAKGVPRNKISVIPPWSLDSAIRYDTVGRHTFRRDHGLAGKFVVMYSGNHSPCHSMETLLKAAHNLRHRSEIAFCFVGGGSEFHRIKETAKADGLTNLLFIPYQPLGRLSASLSAADLHVVVMGDLFVGIVHPSKVYNIRSMGIPFLYIGPPSGHIVELNPAGSFRHSDVQGVEQFILRTSALSLREHPTPSPPADAWRFSRQTLLPRMLQVVNSLTAQPPSTQGIEVFD